MGTMNKMRENTGVVLWILVIAFGGLWVLQDSGAFDAIGFSSGRNLIVVNGDEISADEYNNAVNQQLQNYQAQTGESAPPQMQDLLQEQVYNALVEDRLREQEMERLGIVVTDDEVYQLILGDEPHQLARMFFSDGQGGVDRVLIQNALEDPQQRQQIRQIEQYLRAERRREKLNTLIAASVRVTDQDVEQEYQRRNRRATAEYVALRYASVPDTDVEVTDGDLRDYYNRNRDDFAREQTFEIAYATRSKAATPEDSAAVLDELDRLRPRFAEAEDDSLFLVRNASEQPYSSAFVAAGDLTPDVATALFDGDDPVVGEVVGPVVADGRGHLIKVQEVRPAEEPSVRARHILIPESTPNAREKALEVREELQDGADFAALARRESADPGSAQRGGDLGFFGRGAMVGPFEEAAFDASVGEIVGPVETQYGQHLIQVTARATQEVRIADYVLDVRPSVATLNDAEEQLDDLSFYGGESGDFTGEAERQGLEIQTVQIEADETFIPGLGNSRRILDFLEGADEGDISPVIELNDQFVVVQLQEVTPAGFRPFEEVRTELEPRVRTEKKRAIQAEKLREAVAQTDFDGLADAVGSQLRTAQNISFSNPVIAGLGREPAFAGTALGLEEGETSGVIEGENAVYILRVTGINEPAPLVDARREQIREELLTQRRNQVQRQWISALRDQADVVDNRRQILLQ